MCIRDRLERLRGRRSTSEMTKEKTDIEGLWLLNFPVSRDAVSYTHLRAHETVLDLVCRLLLEKKKKRESNRDS